jgi:hypothetical protein
MLFKQRLPIVDALQFIRGDSGELLRWIAKKGGSATYDERTLTVQVATSGGTALAAWGDYVVRDAAGAWSVAHPAAFEAAFEPTL